MWFGTVTQGLWYLQGLVNDQGLGPTTSDTVSVWINRQGEYKKYRYGWIASPISGEMDFGDDPVGASGFIDNNGFIKLSFFLPSVEADWWFSGQLSVRGIVGVIAGATTRMSWSDGLFLYSHGTLSVRSTTAMRSDQAVATTARGREL